MPGSMPATSQLDWLISITAMIVLFWSRATRDLLKSFGWGIAGTPSIRCTRRSCHFLAARPIASFGPGELAARGARVTTDGANDRICHQGRMPNSGRKRDSLITAETSLIARFNSLQAHPSPAGKRARLTTGLSRHRPLTRWPHRSDALAPQQAADGPFQRKRSDARAIRGATADRPF